jgi:hypothetical protein
MRKLIESIENSSLLPDEIVVVSSGQNIEKVIGKVKININYVHVETSGQSFQKKRGISYFSKQIDWIFMLDDDLLLKKDTLRNLKESITKEIANKTVGIGSKIIYNHETKKSIGSIFAAWLNKPGKIHKSGRVSAYDASNEITPEWLNGASAWKKEVLDKYDLPFLTSKYAAYEDVIFSSRISANDRIFYDPKIEVISQEAIKTVKNVDLTQLRMIVFWNAYLVTQVNRCRISNYKIFSIMRIIRYILFSMHKKDFLKSIKLLSQIIGAPNKKKGLENWALKQIIISNK